MTRNVIAEFSFSTYTDNNGNIQPKKYQVVTGSTFSNAYNEELDSATILLAHIKEEDKLSDILPYEFCHVYDEQGGFDHVYLIDNFYEKEERIGNEKIYSYTIQLMSETKLLEKIHCPNISITHEVIDGRIKKKSIFEKICEYMMLYVPKIKVYDSANGVWKYEPVITNPGDLVPSRHTKRQLSQSYASYYIDSAVGVDIVFPPYSGSNHLIGKVPLNVEIILNNNHLTIDNNYTYDSQNGKFKFHVNADYSGRHNFQIIVKYDLDWDNVPHFEPKLGYDFFYEKFNKPCADLTLSKPTLRQLLTSLMTQVGCIPTVDKLRLSFLDFNKDNGDFALNGDATVGNSVNYVQRALSSDSFVNTLINENDTVLDADSEMVCETIGFRDRSNVLLKQKENLVLETNFPIYKVNKFYIKNLEYLSNLNSNTLPMTWQSKWDPIDGNMNYEPNRKLSMVLNSDANNYYTIKLQVVQPYMDGIYEGISYKHFSWWFNNLKFHLCVFDGKSIKELVVVDNTHTVTLSNGGSISSIDDTALFLVGTYGSQSAEVNQTFTTDVKVTDFDETVNFVWVEGTMTPAIIYNNGNRMKAPNLERQKQPEVRTFDLAWYLNNSSYTKICTSIAIDATKLLKENNVRNQLDNDFTAFEFCETLDQLSSFIYGTVGYSIGDKVISGFSDIYYVGRAVIASWIEQDFTYIESICKFIDKYLENEVEYRVDNFCVPGLKEYPLINQLSFDRSGNMFPFGNYNFSRLIFDIYYQPINSLRVAYCKDKDIPFNIEQYSGSDSGISDFDRLSTNQQEMVDRIGNTTLSISQRIKPENFASYLRGGQDFKPVYYDKYTIFKRTYTINNYHYDVNYTGSESAILKNYFTSIKTKYRAYQYVDYSQSTTRKENDTIYVNLSIFDENNGYFNGDDKIKLGGMLSVDENQGLDTLSYFLYGCLPEYNEDLRIKNVYEKSRLERDWAYKNNVSVITNKNTLALVYQDFDNESPGIYLTSSEAEIGGIPQNWYIFDDYSRESSQIIFSYKNSLSFRKTRYDLSYGELESLSYAMPKDEKIFDMFLDTNPESLEYVAFVLCDDNTKAEIDKISKSTFKDRSEIINRTVQFDFYTNNKEYIAWTDLFIKNCPFANNSNALKPNFWYYSDNIDVNSTEHYLSDNEIDVKECEPFTRGATLQLINVRNGHGSQYEVTNPFIEVNFNYLPSVKNCIKVAYKDPKTGYVRDFIAFKKYSNFNNYYYVSLNDTKSDFVFEKNGGMLIKKYRIAKNTLDREVEDL